MRSPLHILWGVWVSTRPGGVLGMASLSDLCVTASRHGVGKVTENGYQE